MVDTDGTGDGIPPQPTDNATPIRKQKASANRGAPPKCPPPKRKSSELSGKPSGDGVTYMDI